MRRAKRRAGDGEMTTVTLITQCFPPESHAGANRIGAMADALAEVSSLQVVTLLPSYPNPSYHRERRSLEGHDEAIPFAVHRTVEFHPHRGSYLVRGLREMRMALRLALTAYRHGGDVIVATSPSLFVAIGAAAVAALRRVPFVWDVRDVTWSYVRDDPGHTPFVRLLAVVLSGAARLLNRRANLISVSNEGIARHLLSLGAKQDRILQVPNGVSSNLLDRGRELGPPPEGPHKPVVTYAGALGYYQGMSTLVEVAAMTPDVEFRLVGDGPVRDTLVGDVESRGLENVVLPGYVSRDRLLEIYAESDILFAQLRDLPSLEEATFPSKPFEYMATGRPIVYAGRGIAAEFLERTGCALIAEPDDAESIRGCIKTLLDDPGLRHRLGEKGLKEASRHRRDLVMASFARGVLELE